LSQVTLAIRHLRDEQVLLREGGLYWVAVDQASDSAALVVQCLAAMPANARATLVCCGHSSQDLAQKLAADTGPGHLKLFDVESADIGLTLKSLVGELTRAAPIAGSTIVLMLPDSAWQSDVAPALRHCCQSLRQWLGGRGCTLLVVSHGQTPQLHEHLLRLNDTLSGLAQLYRRDGGIRYQLHYWHSELGVCSGQEFELELRADGFALSVNEQANVQLTHTDDQRIYLTQRSVLEGSPPLSDQWRLFENREDLLQQASGARAASIIMAIDTNLQVEELARQIHALRERCGIALKIIVREMEPCLRYRDERLLVSCGANITVPYGTTLAHFFSIIDSAQGQTWRRSRTTDFQSLFERLRPPTERGLLTPREFISTVERVYNGASGEISHQLLKLIPRGGLEIEQYLNQIGLRRFGDVACVVNGAFYLFLFACRADGLEPALGNICRLAWRDLFSNFEIFPGVDALPREDFLTAALLPPTFVLAEERMAGSSSEAAGRAAYSPRRTTLPVTDPCS
jgi:cellulose biosynthesis protein BcsE